MSNKKQFVDIDFAELEKALLAKREIEPIDKLLREMPNGPARERLKAITFPFRYGLRK